MIKFFTTVVLLVFTTFISLSQDVEKGEKLFKQNCSTCHKIDKKLIGPPLDVALQEWGGDKEAMYTWIRNWQDAVNQGYPRAIEIQDYDPSAMNTFPQLTDEDLDDIFAYVDNPNDGAATDSSTTVTEEKTGWSAINWGLVLALLSLVSISLIFAGVIQNIDYSQAQLEGKEVPRKKNIFEIVFNKNVLMALSLISFVVIGYTAYNSAANLGRSMGYQPIQPINYSHKLHAGTLGIDCQYCHTPAAQGKQATIPTVNVCMNCHKNVSEGPTTGTKEIAKIYAAAGFNPNTLEYDLESTGPIEWKRIHNLPDHVYFNHSQHVTVGKIECQTCHGPIEEMEEVKQFSDLSMGWCVDCHRNTEVQFTDNAYYDNLFQDYHNKIKEGDKDFFVTVEKIGGTECQKCHY